MTENLDRRAFLRKSAVGSFGLAGWAAQDEPEKARYTRRMALDYPSDSKAALGGRSSS